ncbi:MAG: DUF3617 domain-containing protein [Sphingomonas sp.]|jgi:hypothetical protein|uniref:DUF3617 domain-containing protein n=1 Tax=Sphingomonas sp. TaxID=28214 RepID=UPI00356AD684
MPRVPLFAALALPLAACGSGGPTVTATNASMAEVATKVADASAGGDMISPGRWEGTMTMHHMQMPDMDKVPPAARAQLERRMGAARPFVSCVTEEEIKAQHGFFTGEDADNKSCRYDHFTMAGGKIDAAMKCTMPTGAMTTAMTGTYSPDAYHMDMASKTEGNAAIGGMSISIDARRAGACRGTPDEH